LLQELLNFSSRTGTSTFNAVIVNVKVKAAIMVMNGLEALLMETACIVMALSVNHVTSSREGSASP
jgi:hypothetical protein